MRLHYTDIGCGTPLVILHGLLGSSHNWQIIARNLSDICRVITMDLPNHGDSPHTAEAGLEVTCASVIETMRVAGVKRAYILGHSMGGKVAMQLSSDYPEIMEGLIVADMLPKAIPPAHLFILRACEGLDLSRFKWRVEIDEELARSITQLEVRSFIIKNILRDGNDVFHWQINLPNIIANYRIVSDAPNLMAPYEGRTLFIGGDSSPYKIGANATLIHRWFPNAAIRTLSNAGHLLHTDQPSAFSAAVRDFITEA